MKNAKNTNNANPSYTKVIIFEIFNKILHKNMVYANLVADKNITIFNVILWCQYAQDSSRPS